MTGEPEPPQDDVKVQSSRTRGEIAYILPFRGREYLFEVCRLRHLRITR